MILIAPLLLALFSQDLPPPALGEVKTWAYQLQGIDRAGALEALEASRYDLLVLEPTRTSRATASFDTKKAVSRLKASPSGDRAHRKLVLAYVDIGEAEDWRGYWTWSQTRWKKGAPRPADWPGFIVKPDPDGWAGNYPVAYWDPPWKEILLGGSRRAPGGGREIESALSEVVSDGFDGVYLDWIEAYEDPDVEKLAKKAGVDARREMIALLGEIRAFGKKSLPGFLVIQQNGGALLKGHPELLKVVDGIAQEHLFWMGEADQDWESPKGYDQPVDRDDTKTAIEFLDQFKAAGKAVFHVEYTLAHAPECYRAGRAKGYIPYCSRTALSRLSTTPPPDAK
jgi:cysteinyl-tRNA synthetase